MSTIKGKISRVIGPVIDVHFDNGVELPQIMDALEVVKEDGSKVILEIQQHIGDNSVRSIAMDSSDGFRRGMEVDLNWFSYPNAKRRCHQRTSI